MGSRMLRDMLNREGFEVGHRHVATLMQRMGIEALRRLSQYEQDAPGPKGLSVRSAWAEDSACEPGLGDSRWCAAGSAIDQSHALRKRRSAELRI